MSNILTRLRETPDLPIFPLPLILLPNELLPLHIFEDKYRQMLRDIEKGGGFFGVTWFEPENDFDEKPAVGTIGCVAEIKETEPLGDGRANILALGLIRYRLLDYLSSDKPYLVAEVEYFEDDELDQNELQPVSDQVFGLFERLAKAAFRLSGGRGTLPEIDKAQPEALSFLITAAFNFENEKKYEFLAETSTVRRLQDLKLVLDQAVEKMEASAEIQAVARTNGHRKAKIDL